MPDHRRQVGDLAATVPGASVLGDPATEVDDVAYDSRRVRPGALFCCVPGQLVDGAAFAGDALRAGATAVLVEQRLSVDVAQIVVPDARAAMAPVAAELWGHPSKRLALVGVTGTNGKTTVTHLLASILAAAGERVEVLGTLSGSRTTPEAPDLQARLAGWADDGVDAVAMEVSSHALALHRVDATRFAVATFTNLGHDHLDFHRSMEAYFQAKASLFLPERADRAVVCLDDPHGRLLHDAAQIPTVGYGVADATGVVTDMTGTSFVWRHVAMHVPMPGAHNLANALAAATSAAELGITVDVIAAGLAAAPPVPGRFQRVEAGQPFAVVVDYAHTPDALAAALAAAREVAGDGRVHVVFGCGGIRDAAKRGPMGEVAGRLADRVVLTSDNPRSEDPAAILDQVRAGVVAGGTAAASTVVVEPDRRAAIALALAAAAPGDVVLVAGKGHEATQTTGTEERPFDDRLVALELLGAPSADAGTGSAPEGSA